MNAEIDPIMECVARIEEIREAAYCQYLPLVNDICSREASENEVGLLLDYMLDFAASGKMLELFRRTCRHFYSRYPNVVASHVYAWRDLYDEEWQLANEKAGVA